jgi:hypothetical protein
MLFLRPLVVLKMKTRDVNEDEGQDEDIDEDRT